MVYYIGRDVLTYKYRVAKKRVIFHVETKNSIIPWSVTTGIGHRNESRPFAEEKLKTAKIITK